MEKESLQRMASIEDEMHLAREKSRSDADFYQMERQAEANKLLLTREYLELEKYKSLSQNSKVYFGQDIPKLFSLGGCVDDPKLGSREQNNS